MIKMDATRDTDVAAIVAMYEDAKERLKDEGIPQWQDGYPNEDSLRRDCMANESVVFYDGDQCVGSAMVSFREEPTYKTIEGSWHLDGPYGVIHRFVVSSEGLHRGYGSKMLGMILLNASCSYWRIDTHEHNLKMCRLLEKNGFVFCGQITLKDGSKRRAYDKIESQTKIKKVGCES